MPSDEGSGQAGLSQPGEHFAMMLVSHQQQPSELWREGVETRMLVSASNGASELCIFDQWVSPGAGAPTHWHPAEEVLTVLAGQAECWIDEERGVLAAGQSLVIPALSNHGFLNIGTVTLHVHAVLASPIFEATPLGGTETTRRWLRARPAGRDVDRGVSR